MIKYIKLRYEARSTALAWQSPCVCIWVAISVEFMSVLCFVEFAGGVDGVDGVAKKYAGTHWAAAFGLGCGVGG